MEKVQMTSVDLLFISLSFFYSFSEISLKEKHKNSHYCKEYKHICSISIVLPIGDHQINRENGH
jgi:hypothetical protein